MKCWRVNKIYQEYNLSGMGNSTGIVDLMQLVNSELMNDFLGIGLLVTIFIIALTAFITSTGGDMTKSLAASSFIAMLMSILLVILDLVPNYIIYLTLAMAALSLVFIKER